MNNRHNAPECATARPLEAGQPYPLGATPDAAGCRFAVFSQHADAVELCLFGSDGAEKRLPLPARTDNFIWHGYVPGVRPDQAYGFRAHGPYDPSAGHRFNRDKLLLDPYARVVAGDLIWHPAVFGGVADAPGHSAGPDRRNSAPYVPRSIVVNPDFDWQDSTRPGVPWEDTFIYECHVRGTTIRHPDVPAELRGTYLGLCSEPMLEHLGRLGVTTVQLMPVQHFVDERALVARSLVNYWGYNPIAWFAPTCRYATHPKADPVAEFKQMVRTFHHVGIEVVLDVVFNHTAEGDHEGPTLSFRGLDNTVYYRLRSDDRRYYENVTGCGNTFNTEHPRGLQVIMDCLRYWVEQMHVDGFRFDLAPALIRTRRGVDPHGPFTMAIAQDPVLSRVKLIAEPWDLGPDGYQLGRFPVGWSEWNDRYRTTVRSLWRGDALPLADVAARLAGSSDIFEVTGRPPRASINYVASHDGFTLRDVVSYERKHNEANGENGHDGSNDNLTRNWGTEGETDDPAINEIRDRIHRNMLATLAVSLGVPMLQAGDELGHTQRGNNNAYCQDNEISWLNWNLGDRQAALRRFAYEVFSWRRTLRALRRPHYLHGRPVCEYGIKDVTWLRADGREMRAEDWPQPSHVLGMALHWHDRGPDGANDGRTLLVVINTHDRRHRFSFPPMPEGVTWTRELDTGRTLKTRDVEGRSFMLTPYSTLMLEGRSR